MARFKKYKTLFTDEDDVTGKKEKSFDVGMIDLDAVVAFNPTTNPEHTNVYFSSGFAYTVAVPFAQVEKDIVNGRGVNLPPDKYFIDSEGSLWKDCDPNGVDMSGKVKIYKLKS